MYPLKRIAAYVIDYALVLLPTLIGLSALASIYQERLPGDVQRYIHVAQWGLSLLAPALVLGVMTGLTGRTPGKLIMFLRVHDGCGDPPGLVQGVVREIVKAVSLGFLFGMLYALQALVTNQQTYYDLWLNLEVEDLRPVGLTPTQKKFRQYMREKQRREAKERR
jgi:uncharacterized RDD family membrane protein YckC